MCTLRKCQLTLHVKNAEHEAVYVIDLIQFRPTGMQQQILGEPLDVANQQASELHASDASRSTGCGASQVSRAHSAVLNGNIIYFLTVSETWRVTMQTLQTKNVISEPQQIMKSLSDM